MKSILLIGLGRFGTYVAQKLCELQLQVMAVDLSEERVNAALPYVTSALIGDGTNEEFLRSLGVRNYDVCIVAVGGDFQSSLEATSLLKDLGAKLVVARADREVQAKFLLRNGADEVVNPEKQVAAWTAIRYSSDRLFDYIELNQDYAIFELSVPESWVGKSVRQLDTRGRYGINLLGTKKGGELNLNITPDLVLEQDKTILVLGSNRDVQKCFHL